MNLRAVVSVLTNSTFHKVLLIVSLLLLGILSPVTSLSNAAQVAWFVAVFSAIGTVFRPQCIVVWRLATDINYRGYRWMSFRGGR